MTYWAAKEKQSCASGLADLGLNKRERDKMILLLGREANLKR